MKLTSIRLPSIFATLIFVLPINAVHATVFDLPAFLEPGHVAFGLEADVPLTDGAGAGFNFKPRVGLSDFLNLQAIIGTGSGDRKLRAGATLGIEYFPDINWQPGIASPVTFLYTNLRGEGNTALYVTPLLYKTFHSQDGVGFTPFVGLPIGWNARKSVLRGFTQIALGTMFAPRNLASFRFTAEAAFNLHQSYTYIAGGVTFFLGGYDWNRGKGTGPGGNEAAPGQQPVDPNGAQPAIDDQARYNVPQLLGPQAI